MDGKSTTSKASNKCPKNTIWFYRESDDFGFLSNFWAADINIDGKIWPSTEHYFQAMKFPTEPKHQEKIRANRNPAAAKRSGKCSTGFRQDWDRVKDDVMYNSLVAKFTQHQDLRQMLLDTGDSHLVEHTKRDKYWGDGGDGGNDKIGRNMLGKLLVRVRNQIRDGTIQSIEIKEPVKASQGPQPTSQTPAITSQVPATNSQGVLDDLSEDAINQLIKDSGIVLEKNAKRSKRKDIDFVLKRLESQVSKLQHEGASSFQDESSLAPSNLYKRGLLSQAPSQRPKTARDQMSALDDGGIDEDELEEGAKKRKIKEKQKREADKEIDKRNKAEKEKEEKKKQKKAADSNAVMKSGRINALLSKTGSGSFDKEADDRIEKEAEDLITMMIEAALVDRDLYKEKKPALNKLLKAPHIYEKLKNLYLQEKFLDQKGVTYLIQWLEPLAENVYPNVGLQEGVLDCLDKLNVQPPDIEDKDIYELLTEYIRAKDISQPIRRRAMSLKDKWEHLRSQRGGFEDEADEDEENEDIMQRNNEKYEQYRKLQIKIEQFRRIRLQQIEDGSDSDESKNPEEVKQPAAKRPKVDALMMPPPPPVKRSGDLEMTSEGMRLPERNAFDFVKAPSKDAFRSFAAEKRSATSIGKESGRVKMQRALMNLKKKKNMSTVGNKNMNLVKAQDDLQGTDV